MKRNYARECFHVMNCNKEQKTNLLNVVHSLLFACETFFLCLLHTKRPLPFASFRYTYPRIYDMKHVNIDVRAQVTNAEIFELFTYIYDF